MMKSCQVLTPFVAMLLVSAASAFGGSNYLLTSECITSNGVCSTVELVTYEFLDGVLSSTKRGQRFDVVDVRFGLGENRIVQDRFLVSHWGDVYDLRELKLLHQGIGQVKAVDGSRVIQDVNRDDVEGVFQFDLDSHEYTLVEKKSEWLLPGLLSPDHQKSVSVSEWGDGTIKLHDREGSATTLATMHCVSLDRRSSELGKPPVLWLDNEKVLTQEANGVLVILGLDSSVQPLLKIPVDASLISSPDLERGPEGQILYFLGDDIYEIDIRKRSFRLLDYLPIGDGFDIEINNDRTRGKRIRHLGETIGEYWFVRHSAATAEGRIAVEYGPIGSNLGYPKGVAVWGVESQSWTEIKISFIEALLGWVEGQ